MPMPEAGLGGLGARGAGTHPTARYLDEEAVADVTDLHGVGVRLADVLLHLQDGPAVQGELPFLLQDRTGRRSVSAPGMPAPSPPGRPTAQEAEQGWAPLTLPVSTS